MGKINDLSGVRFSRLTVLDRYIMKNRYAYWECVCDCGNTKLVRGSHLISGNVKSCGCLLVENKTTHGGTCDHRYAIANKIINRCSEKYIRAEHYYHKGVKNLLGETQGDVYKSLLKVSGYFPGASIDRIDNNGHYDIPNLRWATQSEQALNKSNNIDFSKPLTRARMKAACDVRGWDIVNFTEEFSGEYYVSPKGKRNKMYFYNEF